MVERATGSEADSAEEHSADSEGRSCGNTFESSSEEWTDPNASVPRPGASARNSARAIRRQPTNKIPKSQWDEVNKRKWRPPENMYQSQMHEKFRGYACSQLQSMPSFRSVEAKRTLKEGTKVLTAEGKLNPERKVAVLMLCEIIPPAAVRAIFGNHEPSEVEIERQLLISLPSWDQAVCRFVPKAMGVYGKAKLKEGRKALTAERKINQERKVAVLMMCEIIPPAAVCAIFAYPRAKEFRAHPRAKEFRAQVRWLRHLAEVV